MVDTAVLGWVNFPSKCVQITPLWKKMILSFVVLSLISNLCSLVATSWNLIGTQFETPGGNVSGGRASASTIQKTFAFVGGESQINPLYRCGFFNQSKEECPSKSFSQPQPAISQQNMDLKCCSKVFNCCKTVAH